MVARFAARLVFGLGLVLAAAALADAAAETRAAFRDWAVVCPGDSDGRDACAALGAVRDPAGPAGLSHTLRITIADPGSLPQIIFTPILRGADTTRPVEFQVDQDPVVTLAPGRDDGQAGAVNDYRLSDPAIARRLIALMKDGGSLAVRYTDRTGAAATATFSLWGLTAALDALAEKAPAAAALIPAVPPATPGAGDGSEAAPAPPRQPATDVEARSSAGAAAPLLLCSGNEPFWSLRIDGPLGRWMELAGAGEPQPVPLSGALAEATWADPPLTVWRGHSGPGEGRDLVAMITAEACPDTMADITHPYRARLSLADGSLRLGCCRGGGDTAAAKAPPAVDPVPVLPAVSLDDLGSRPADDWSRHFADLRHGIGACLARLDEPVRVLKAWPMNKGMAGVRIDAGGGERADCIAAIAGGSVERIDWLAADAAPLPGQGRPLFTPATFGAPPAGDCQRSEAVVGPFEAVIGWLTYPGC